MTNLNPNGGGGIFAGCHGQKGPAYLGANQVFRKKDQPHEDSPDQIVLFEIGIEGETGQGEPGDPEDADDPTCEALRLPDDDQKNFPKTQGRQRQEVPLQLEDGSPDEVG